MSIVSSISKTLAGNLGEAGTRAIGSGLLWGGLAAAGTAGYNAATGESGGVGTAFALGAIGMGGRKYFSKLNKGAGAGKWGVNFKKSGGFHNIAKQGDLLAGRTTKSMSEYFGKSKNAWVSKNARMLGRYVGGAHAGAIAGGVLGAGYGVFSDQESMMSGAFKGAVLGGAAGGIYKGAFNKKFTHLPGVRNRTAELAKQRADRNMLIRNKKVGTTGGQVKLKMGTPEMKQYIANRRMKMDEEHYNNMMRQRERAISTGAMEKFMRKNDPARLRYKEINRNMRMLNNLGELG